MSEAAAARSHRRRCTPQRGRTVRSFDLGLRHAGRHRPQSPRQSLQECAGGACLRADAVRLVLGIGRLERRSAGIAGDDR
ncbi:MAG: hypothetical protein MZW92_13785 [Comamonadaceae bacterium]|nr:hypothetical protein [Comamonadaceae bacterium]